MPVKIKLTARCEELLRVARERYPDETPEEILEQALAERIAREQTNSQGARQRTAVEFREWLDKFAAFSEKIPPLAGETFTRDSLYQDHD
jgi:class 3 adenylate cyclase